MDNCKNAEHQGPHRQPNIELSPKVSGALSMYPDNSDAIAQKSLVEASTPESQVSAFCRAVLNNILPNDFLGDGQDGKHNRAALMSSVDEFVYCKKFDNLTLQTVAGNIKVCEKQTCRLCSLISIS